MELTFSSLDDGCRMDFTQEGVDASIVEKPWAAMFDRLARIVAASPA